MRSRELLTDGRRVKVTEQVGMCLYMLAKGASYRDIADTFKHSISTVHKYLKKVIAALKVLSFDIKRPHTPLEEIPQKIMSSSLYSPFEGCIGAIDGTHIQAVLGDEHGMQYRGRKGTKTWNVLACCSFEMLFTYVQLRLEGSVHDETVWKDSITPSKYCFPHPPPDKYYLVDSGYPNIRGYLAPYKEGNTRCHMPTFKKGGIPIGIYEKFNYRHSSLRTTIERAFGILKSTWKVLRVMPQVVDVCQLEIILATFTLHNFIRMHELQMPILSNEEVEGVADSDLYNQRRKDQMNSVRNFIARQIMEVDPVK
ncbi:unnamed protein product [Rhodiola kirilowii]